MFDSSKPKIGCSNSITNRWTCFEVVRCSKNNVGVCLLLDKMVFDKSLMISHSRECIIRTLFPPYTVIFTYEFNIEESKVLNTGLPLTYHVTTHVNDISISITWLLCICTVYFRLQKKIPTSKVKEYSYIIFFWGTCFIAVPSLGRPSLHF